MSGNKAVLMRRLQTSKANVEDDILDQVGFDFFAVLFGSDTNLFCLSTPSGVLSKR